MGNGAERTDGSQKKELKVKNYTESPIINPPRSNLSKIKFRSVSRARTTTAKNQTRPKKAAVDSTNAGILAG